MADARRAGLLATAGAPPTASARVPRLELVERERGWGPWAGSRPPPRRCRVARRGLVRLAFPPAARQAARAAAPGAGEGAGAPPGAGRGGGGGARAGHAA